jgi:branched-chain amino acid aminotransferase group I
MTRPLDPARLPDPRNADIVVWVDGALWPRDEAKVSVFDSSVQGGDAVWEGLRVYDGGVFRLTAHLDRLFDSAAALAFAEVPDRAEVIDALTRTLVANGMRDGAHVRLTLTRGPKDTSGMSPVWNRSGPVLIVLAEWKPPVFGQLGLRLITSRWRRNHPDCLPSTIHHANLINNILAKLEADAAGVDDAVMYDLDGHLAETNATNLFVVKDGALATPDGHGLPGITRGVVLEIGEAAGLEARARVVTAEEVEAADEIFSTGTMGELVPVLEIDGRRVGNGDPGPVTARMQQLFGEVVARECEPLEL